MPFSYNSYRLMILAWSQELVRNIPLHLRVHFQEFNAALPGLHIDYIS